MYNIVHWTVFKGHIPFVVIIKRWPYSPCVPVLAFSSSARVPVLAFSLSARFGRWRSPSSRAGSPEALLQPGSPPRPLGPPARCPGETRPLFPGLHGFFCVWSPSSWLCSSSKLSEKWRVECEFLESSHAGECIYSGSHVMDDVVGSRSHFPSGLSGPPRLAPGVAAAEPDTARKVDPWALQL